MEEGDEDDEDEHEEPIRRSFHGISSLWRKFEGASYKKRIFEHRNSVTDVC